MQTLTFLCLFQHNLNLCHFIKLFCTDHCSRQWWNKSSYFTAGNELKCQGKRTEGECNFFFFKYSIIKENIFFKKLAIFKCITVLNVFVEQHLCFSNVSFLLLCFVTFYLHHLARFFFFRVIKFPVATCFTLSNHKLKCRRICLRLAF